MSENMVNLIKRIPMLSRQDANNLVSKCLEENIYIEALLDFIGFVDSNIADRVIMVAMRNNISIEKLLLAINPFTDKRINDQIVSLCIQKGVNAEGIVGKAFPFTSISVADEVADYAIEMACNPESLLNAAPPFVTAKMAEKLFEYAFSQNINPNYFSNKDYSMINPHINEMVKAYVNKMNNSANDMFRARLINVFNEAGIFLNEERPNEPLQLDSLHYISIICEIENEFDVEIPDEVLSENILSTFQDFLNLVVKR